MSLAMPRPAFTVVSSSVAALVVLGFIAQAFKSKIPQTPVNDLGHEGSEFLNRAAMQRIDWHKPTPESFALAKRRDLPILLFVGSSYNPLARGFDEGIENSPRVQSFLERNFLCIRADTLAYPAFRNAFLPLSRASLNLSSGFQVWVLDTSGSILDLLPQNLGVFPRQENLYIDALVTAREKFAAPSLDVIESRFQDAQVRDQALLRIPAVENVPDFEAFEERFFSEVSQNGGFEGGLIKQLTPEAWRYLLLTGRLSDFKNGIEPILHSSVVDLIDGGFFHGSRDPNWKFVDYDKSATANASMLRTLGMASKQDPSGLYSYLARRTFESLTTEFVVVAGVAAQRPSDAGEDGRSRRSSFGVRKLQQTLGGTPWMRWAQDHLGLRVESNPLMTPRLASPESLADRGPLGETLSKLRHASPANPCQAPGFADVTGFTVARLLESARLMNEQKMLNKAVDLFPFIEEFRQGPNMTHSFHRSVQDAYLGDYLAYADAALNLYLATGRYDALLEGRSVLERALVLFAGDASGIIGMTGASQEPMPENLSLSEVADPVIESTVAQAIRLCLDYSRIFPESLGLRRAADQSVIAFTVAARNQGYRAAGYFAACQSVFDDAYFVSTGPYAQELADKVARLHPARLSFAAFGDVRLDIQDRGPGVYIVKGILVEGPMSAADAAAKVPVTLGSG